MEKRYWLPLKAVKLPSKSEQENDQNNHSSMLGTSGRERRQLARSTSIWLESQLEPNNHNQSTAVSVGLSVMTKSPNSSEFHCANHSMKWQTTRGRRTL